MSNSNGRIYTDASHGISIADIQTVLNTSRNDIGGIINNATNINKWSKCKPVRYPGHATPTDSGKLSILYGLEIPMCSAANFSSRYNTAWTYNKPRGKGQGSGGADEWFRILDFNNYQHNTWPNSSSNTSIQTIFNGTFTIPGVTLGSLDTIYFSMQCRENEDTDTYLGLLYPYDFYQANSPYDLSDYYVGFALKDNAGDVFIYAGPHVSDYFDVQNYNVDVSITAPIPPSASTGQCIIAPILAENHTIPSGSASPVWSGNYNGGFVTLNGAYLSATKVADNDRLLVEFTNVSLSSTALSFRVTFTNNTVDLVQFNDIVGYLLSDDAYMNEHSNLSGYSGPDYYSPSASDYIMTEWPSYYQGDITTSIRTGEAENPDELSARYIIDNTTNRNLFQAFRAANSGSYNDRALGNMQSVQFDVTMSTDMIRNSRVGDDFGPYSAGAHIFLGLIVQGFNVMREYQII